MDTQHPAAAAGGPLITYTRCWDARTFVVRAPLSADDRQRLQRILDGLASLGTIALGRADMAVEDVEGLSGTIDTLRRTLNPRAVDAVAAAADHPATAFVSPQAVIPLWDFEPVRHTADALVAHGLLLGHDLKVEAFRVQDADDPVPVTSGHALWRLAAGQADALGTAYIPGGTGPYAVFAALRAG